MPAAYDRCVKKVGHKKGAKSANAICTSVNAGNVKAYRRKKKGRKKKGKGY